MPDTTVKSLRGNQQQGPLAAIRNYIGAANLLFRFEACALSPMTEGIRPSMRPDVTGPKNPVPPQSNRDAAIPERKAVLQDYLFGTDDWLLDVKLPERILERKVASQGYSIGKCIRAETNICLEDRKIMMDSKSYVVYDRWTDKSNSVI